MNDDDGTLHQRFERLQMLGARAAQARQRWLIAATDGSERIEQLVARDRMLHAERDQRRAEMLRAEIDLLFGEIDVLVAASEARLLS